MAKKLNRPFPKRSFLFLGDIFSEGYKVAYEKVFLNLIKHSVDSLLKIVPIRNTLKHTYQHVGQVSPVSEPTQR